MSEEKTVEVQDVKQDTTETASEKQTVNQVPYSRFSEMVDEKNTLKVELDSLKKEAKQQAENRKLKEMESKGEYDKIMAEMTSKLESAETKAKAFDDYQASRRESLLSKLPEDDRAIYDGLSLEKLEVHVDRVSTKPSPASVDNSTPTSTGGYASFEEWATLDPKGYKKANDPQTSGKIKIGYGD
jgi:phage-related minor tail protein